MRKSFPLVLVTGVLFWTAAVAQELVTEVIRIGYRTVEEVLPIVRPLVPRPGSVSGIAGQLVIRTTPANMVEIKQVLERIDQAPRNLMITVRRGLSQHVARGEEDVFVRSKDGDIRVSTGRPIRRGPGVVVQGGGQDIKGGVRIRRTHSRGDEKNLQRIRVLEGREAFISFGESVPFAQRSITISGTNTTVQDSVEYKDLVTGVHVVPRLSGEHVILDVSPQSSRLSERGGGVIETESASTRVSGRLGEWIQIGGIGESENRSGGGTTYSTRTRRSSQRSIYVKVEEALR